MPQRRFIEAAMRKFVRKLLSRERLVTSSIVFVKESKVFVN